MTTVAVVTIVHGRHDHLRGQLWGLHRQLRAPDLHVVVAMGDPDVEQVVADDADAPWLSVLVPVPLVDGRLPLAAARNAGVAAAAARGAEVVVLLDVDCIPSAGLVERYAAALDPRDRRRSRPVVVCGEVRYLSAAATAAPVGEWTWDGLRAHERRHPARPALGPGVRGMRDTTEFWSLSFATTVGAWREIGGFDEAYVGYGGEDTDFGQRISAADGTVLWLGEAMALHQDHASSSPPVEHLADVVENASRFAERWGWWPMRGWLDEFEDLGLVARTADGGYALTSRGRRQGAPV